MFIPVILSEQIQPGTFEFALDHMVEHELDQSALDASVLIEKFVELSATPRI
jgi:hypothetical protein